MHLQSVVIVCASQARPAVRSAKASTRLAFTMHSRPNSRKTTSMVENSVFCRFFERLDGYAVIVLDPKGNILSWNVGAHKIKGYESEEIIGQHFSRFYTSESRAAGHPERELAAAAALGQYEEEGWRVRKDQNRFWAHVVITAIYDDDGEILGFGKVTRDLTQIKQEAEQLANVMALLESTSRTDFLTGLGNRRSFDEALTANLAAAKRYTRPLSFAMLDLDHFKGFNDTNGHPNGDRYLKRASIAWRSGLRAEDFLGRYGGEEFAVILPDTGIVQAMVSANRVRMATPEPITCSIGIAQWDGNETAGSLIGRADQALYVAKESGRDQVRQSPSPDAVVKPFPPHRKLLRRGPEKTTPGKTPGEPS